MDGNSQGQHLNKEGGRAEKNIPRPLQRYLSLAKPNRNSGGRGAHVKQSIGQAAIWAPPGVLSRGRLQGTDEALSWLNQAGQFGL